MFMKTQKSHTHHTILVGIRIVYLLYTFLVYLLSNIYSIIHEILLYINNASIYIYTYKTSEWIRTKMMRALLQKYREWKINAFIIVSKCNKLYSCSLCICIYIYLVSNKMSMFGHVCLFSFEIFNGIVKYVVRCFIALIKSHCMSHSLFGIYRCYSNIYKI